MTVVKDVFVGGVQTGLHTVFNYHTGSGRILQLLHLEHTHTQTPPN